MEKTRALRITERKTVKNIRGPIKGGECLRIRKNKDIKDTLQGVDIVKLTKFLHLRCYGQVERMQQKKSEHTLQRVQWKKQGQEDNHSKDGRRRFKGI